MFHEVLIFMFLISSLLYEEKECKREREKVIQSYLPTFHLSAIHLAPHYIHDTLMFRDEKGACHFFLYLQLCFRGDEHQLGEEMIEFCVNFVI